MSTSNAASSKPAVPILAPARGEARLSQSLTGTAATVGVIVAGVALLEVALIPGVLLGGAAMLAPKYLPKLGLALRPLLRSRLPQRIESTVAVPGAADAGAPLVAARRFAIKRTVAKTITFRIIVTALDFTVNFVVLGELATAAGLSAFALVVGPLFYLVHEAAWNYYAASGERIDLAALLPHPKRAKALPPAQGRLTIGRALAKTITFRTIATTMDFTANFVVVGDAATAVALSASGFILGPFVYFGHEKAWDYFGPPGEAMFDSPVAVDLLPAPG